MGQRHPCVCAEGAHSLPQLVSRQLQQGIKGCWQQLLGQQAPPLPLLLLLPDLQGRADICVKVDTVTLTVSLCSPSSCAAHVKRRAELLGRVQQDVDMWQNSWEFLLRNLVSVLD